MKYVFSDGARRSAFWRAAAENCVRHIWHSFIMWSCRLPRSVGGGRCVFNTFMIHHKSGCISHPQASLRLRLFAFFFFLFSVSILARLPLLVVFTLSEERKKEEKSLEIIFPDVAEKEIQTSEKKKDETRVVLCAWCFPQIFTYPSSAFVNSRFVVLSMICVHGSSARWLPELLLAVDNNHAEVILNWDFLRIFAIIVDIFRSSSDKEEKNVIVCCAGLFQLAFVVSTVIVTLLIIKLQNCFMKVIKLIQVLTRRKEIYYLTDILWHSLSWMDKNLKGLRNSDEKKYSKLF